MQSQITDFQKKKKKDESKNKSESQKWLEKDQKYIFETFIGDETNAKEKNKGYTEKTIV